MFHWLFNRRGKKKDLLVTVQIPWLFPGKKIMPRLKKCLPYITKQEENVIKSECSNECGRFRVHATHYEYKLLIKKGFRISTVRSLYHSEEDIQKTADNCGCSTICAGCGEEYNTAHPAIILGEYNIQALVEDV